MDEIVEGEKNLEISAEDSEMHSELTEIEQAELTSDGKCKSDDTEHCDGAEVGATGGSEETFDILCQQCVEDEKHVEACMYCTECEEYLCELCVNMHRKVRLTKRHTLVSKENFGGHNEGIYETMKPTCSKHTGEQLDWFCSGHSTACCFVCRSIYHEKCDGVVTLEAAIEESLLNERVKDALAVLEQTRSHLRGTISKAQEYLENLDRDREESLIELEKVRKEIEKEFQRLNKLVSDDKEKIEKKYKEIKENVECDIEKRSKVEKTLAGSTKVLLNERLNDKYKFVQTLEAESSLEAFKDTAIATFDDLNFEKIRYERDKILVKNLQAFDKLGYTDSEKTIYSVSSPKELNVLYDSEQNSTILSIYQVDGQHLVLADWGNTSLKLMNTLEETVKQSVKLSHRPFDICRVGEEERIAVSLLHMRKVVFISFSGFVLVPLEGTIETGEKCRGIAHFNSNLYVACGGGLTGNEGHGHIRVYSLDGKLQQTFLSENCSMAKINQPWKIRFQPYTDKALVTDENKILTVNTKSKQEICDFARNINRRSDLSFDAEGRVFVTDYESSLVDILSVNGHRRASLLTKDNLPSKPRVSAVDSINSRLYVAMENSKFILCFDIKKNNWTMPPSF